MLVITLAAHANANQLTGAEPLKSLHGTMITMVSDDEGMPMDYWIKGNNERSELQTNGSNIICIRRGNRLYTFGEGSSTGDVRVVRRGLASMSLIRQIEQIKTHGVVKGSKDIEGEIHDIYHYEVNAPTESAIVYLSRETSIPDSGSVR